MFRLSCNSRILITFLCAISIIQRPNGAILRFIQYIQTQVKDVALPGISTIDIRRTNDCLIFMMKISSQERPIWCWIKTLFKDQEPVTL